MKGDEELPTNVDAEIESWLALGLQRLGEGKCSEAVSHWYRVLDLEPEHALAIERIKWVRSFFHVEIQTDAWGSQSQMVLLQDEVEDDSGVLPDFDIDVGEWPNENSTQEDVSDAMLPVEEIGLLGPIANVGDWIARALAVEKRDADASSILDDISAAARTSAEGRGRPTLFANDTTVELTEQSAFAISLPKITHILTPEAFGPAPVDLGWSNPWDAAIGLTEAIDLDLHPVLPNRIHEVLELHAENGADQQGGGRTAAALRTSRLAGPDFAAHTSPEEQVTRLMAQAEHRFALGDFSGAETDIRSLLKHKPDDEEALACLASIESMLLKMFESTLGDLRHVPRLVSSGDEIIWMNLHQRAAFLLAQIDGSLTYEDLIAVSGLGRLETFRILAELVRARVIH